MKIACVGYRGWALEIYDEIARQTGHTVLIIRSKEQYNAQILYEFKPDLALFYGWSWKISPTLVETFTSIMLHPSPLPKYRGGSPLQNQIIAGEKTSAVTLFVMDSLIDSGDIIAQEEISLEGHLEEIFSRITEVGLRLTLDLLENGFTRSPQDHSQASVFRRRKPEDSEITIKELNEASANYLYDKIRMLEDPYPNAFIRTSDGKRLLINRATISPE